MHHYPEAHLTSLRYVGSVRAIFAWVLKQFGSDHRGTGVSSLDEIRNIQGGVAVDKAGLSHC